MLEVGDTVVTMAAPGRFTVVTVAGPLLTIENRDGVRKTVVESSLRKLAPPSDQRERPEKETPAADT